MKQEIERGVETEKSESKEKWMERGRGRLDEEGEIELQGRERRVKHSHFFKVF